MKELKPAEILKAVHTCGSSFCTTDHHECPYGDDGCIDCVDRLEADFETLIAAGNGLIIRRAAPENKALTLEQLRRMDGEPVWCVGSEENVFCTLVDSENNLCVDIECNYLEFSGYGITDDFNKLRRGSWLAYAHKPEGDGT